MKTIYLIIFSLYSLYGFSQKEIINSNLSGPLGIIEKDDILYIAEGTISEITTISLNDPSLTKETYLTLSGSPMFLDVIGDFLYYSEFNENNISRVDLTQTTPTPEVLVSNMNTSSDFIVDGSNLYYTQYSGIYKLDMAATDPISTVIIDGQDSPKGIIKYEDHIYYSEAWDDRISKISLLDTNPIPEIVLSDLDHPTGLVIHENELFFIQYVSQKISKIDLASTMPFITTIDSFIYAGDLLFIDNDLYATGLFDGFLVKYNDLITVNSTEISNQGFNIYPNPTNDYINFEKYQKYAIKNISIFDLSGTLVSSNRYTYENDRLNLSQLSSGVYFIKVTGDNWMETKKIIRL